MKALVIDDEIQIRRLLRIALEGDGYEVVDAENGTLGLQLLVHARPDIVLLDLGLPDLGGLDVLKRLRGWSEVPVVVLTVRDSEVEKITALDAGADDFVTKPFSTGELLARLRAATRRAHPREEVPVFCRNGLTVDFSARVATRDGCEIHLTATEWAILALLVRHSGRILTHTQILRDVWGPNASEHREYLRVYFTRLRKKIEADPSIPVLITNEPGVGYRFAAAE